MKTRTITVTSRIDGAGARAELVCCPKCDSEKFVIYTISGHDHPHLQCCKCQETYCQGKCHLAPPSNGKPT